MHVHTSTITVEKRERITESIMIGEWSKRTSLEDFNIHVTASIEHGRAEVEGWLTLQAALRLEPELVHEKYIDGLADLVEDTAKKILLP